MNRILPFLPTTKPISGVEAARRFDEAAFDAHPSLDAYVRPMVELEFSDAPEALRNALAQLPMKPFCVVVQVTRGTGLFLHRREVLQVRAVEGFDPSRAGTLRGGFLTNTSTDREPEPKSLGELSAMLYGPRAT